MFFTCFHRNCWVQQTGHALKRSMFYIVPFTNKRFKSIWTCCCDSAHMPSQNNPQLDCKWWHLCGPALILHYPALISPPQHDQFISIYLPDLRNNKRPWRSLKLHNFSTGRHQEQKFENSKNGTSSQNAKTGTTKDEKRENHENHRRHENREINFLVFSVFLVFSGFLMSMHLIVLATTRKLLA